MFNTRGQPGPVGDPSIISMNEEFFCFFGSMPSTLNSLYWKILIKEARIIIRIKYDECIRPIDDDEEEEDDGEKQYKTPRSLREYSIF